MGRIIFFHLLGLKKNGIDIQIRRYKKISVYDNDERQDSIYIPFDNENQLMLRYEIINEIG